MTREDESQDKMMGGHIPSKQNYMGYMGFVSNSFVKGGGLVVGGGGRPAARFLAFGRRDPRPSNLCIDMCVCLCVEERTVVFACIEPNRGGKKEKNPSSITTDHHHNHHQ